MFVAGGSTAAWNADRRGSRCFGSDGSEQGECPQSPAKLPLLHSRSVALLVRFESLCPFFPRQAPDAQAAAALLAMPSNEAAKMMDAMPANKVLTHVLFFTADDAHDVLLAAMQAAGAMMAMDPAQAASIMTSMDPSKAGSTFAPRCISI